MVDHFNGSTRSKGAIESVSVLWDTFSASTVCHRQPEMDRLFALEISVWHVQSLSETSVYSSAYSVSAYTQNAGDLEEMAFTDALRPKLEDWFCALSVFLSVTVLC